MLIYCPLTLYTLTSECIFSILFSIHFLGADKENLIDNQELLKNFKCDWLTELSDNKLSDNNLASELVGNRVFLNQ